MVHRLTIALAAIRIMEKKQVLPSGFSSQENLKTEVEASNCTGSVSRAVPLPGQQRV